MGKIPQIGQRVLVIGAGNVAVDAARSLLRLGKEVTIVYRRGKEDMPANATEIKESEEEKIRYCFLSSPVEIITDSSGQVRALRVEKNDTGRHRPIRKKKVCCYRNI